MKKENFRLQSEALVCAPEFAQGSFMWVKVINGSYMGLPETVNVIALNCNTKEEIKPLLERIKGQMDGELAKLNAQYDEAKKNIEELKKVQDEKERAYERVHLVDRAMRPMRTLTFEREPKDQQELILEVGRLLDVELEKAKAAYAEAQKQAIDANKAAQMINSSISNALSNISYVNGLLGKIGSSFEKDVHSELLAALSSGSGLNITKDMVIYLSGVVA